MDLFMKMTGLSNNSIFTLFVCAFLFLTVSVTVVQTQENTSMTPQVVNVVDGDTINIILTPLNSYPPLNAVKIRIRGIDTPESTWRAKCTQEKELGKEAKAFLEDLIGNVKVIEITNYEWGKYGGRIIADASVKGIDIGTAMINNGYANAYTGKGSKPDWCN